MIHTFERDLVQDYAIWENFFSPEECDTIIRVGLRKKLSRGKVQGNIQDQGKQVESFVRTNKVSWIGTDEIDWLYNKMEFAVVDINSKFFNFHIYGFGEMMQFSEYTAPDGEYGKHCDRYYNKIPRKISMVVQLSDPNDYVGGDLELHTNSYEPVIAPKTRGSIFCFPSYTLHCVKPVTEGKRYSLVAWVSGRPFT